MKKILSVLLVLSMLLSASAALAEGMGVQVIGGPETETEPVSLDDLKLETEAEIEGWGILTLTAYEVQDGLGYYRSGKTYVYSVSKDYYWSGKEAEYAVLYADILNTQLKDKNYLENVSVKAVYDDTYEYAGWFHQRNYNNGTDNFASLEVDESKQNTRWVVNASDQFSISPMYEGHYIFGCTLPNAVINGSKSLKLIITIDGNEITYNIRK